MPQHAALIPWREEGWGLEAAILSWKENPLKPFAKSADKIIDSSDYSIHDLRRKLSKKKIQ